MMNSKVYYEPVQSYKHDEEVNNNKNYDAPQITDWKKVEKKIRLIFHLLYTFLLLSLLIGFTIRIRMSETKGGKKDYWGACGNSECLSRESHSIIW